MATNTMNERVAASLLAAKQIYLEGDALLNRSDPAGRVLAVLHLDLAVETILKATLQFRGTPAESGIGFKELVKRVKADVPAAASLRPFRDIRNNAQHDGLAPAADQLPLFRDAALACLKESFTVCGADFFRFTTAELVTNKQTREFLDIAVAMADDDPVWSLTAGWETFKWINACLKFLAADALGKTMWESYDPRNGLFLRSDTEDGKAQARGELLDVVALNLLGVDLADQIRFRELASSAAKAFRARGDDRAPRESEPKCSAADAWWAADLLARHAYRMEQQFPKAKTMDGDDTQATAEMFGLLPAIVMLDD